MDIAEAVEIISKQAKCDGVGVLELSETINKYGLEKYIKSMALDQGPDSGDDFRTAVDTFRLLDASFSQPRLDFL